MGSPKLIIEERERERERERGRLKESLFVEGVEEEDELINLRLKYWPSICSRPIIIYVHDHAAMYCGILQVY